MDNEIWKYIDGYEGSYEVSTHGNIRSYLYTGISKNKRDEPINLTPVPTNIGYMKIGLSKDGEQSYPSIHRLVAEAFIPNPENKRTVNHKDGDKKNNHVLNLEWATYSENIQHSVKHGLQGHSRGERSATKLTKNDVIDIRELAKTGKYTHKEIGQRFGISRRYAGEIINKRKWAHI